MTTHIPPHEPEAHLPEHGFHPHPHPVLHEIFVNGKPRTYHHEHISYAEVVHIANPEGPFDILYTVAYANFHGHDGTLAPGQSTTVHNAMEFRVRKTHRS
jgi:hypothetical protein